MDHVLRWPRGALAPSDGRAYLIVMLAVMTVFCVGLELATKRKVGGRTRQTKISYCVQVWRCISVSPSRYLFRVAQVFIKLFLCWRRMRQSLFGSMRSRCHCRCKEVSAYWSELWPPGLFSPSALYEIQLLRKEGKNQHDMMLKIKSLIWSRYETQRLRQVNVFSVRLLFLRGGQYWLIIANLAQLIQLTFLQFI